MSKKSGLQDTFTDWRASYLRLRSLERALVSESRSGEDPVRIAAMHETVEVHRSATTALFHLAQTASMPSQIPPIRSLESR